MLTLDRLINVIGSYGARLSCCPVSRNIQLHSVAVHDPGDPRAIVGDVLLAVGAVSPLEAVELAELAQARVVMVRSEGLDPAATAAATDRQIAVLTVDPAMSWSHLAGVVFGLVLEGRETASGRGPTDLFALADSLAGAIGGSVVIQDPASWVIAYSTAGAGADPLRALTILGRRVPDDARELYEKWGVFTHLASSEEPLFVPPAPEEGFNGRMVVAVRSGRSLLGSVWVQSAVELTGERRAALTDGARKVALHLLRSRASADLERHVESELVTWLLEGGRDAAVLASRLGLPYGRQRVIAVRAHIDGERHAASLLAFERATAGFGWSRPGRTALLGDTLYTVLPGEGLRPAYEWVDALRGSLPGEVAMSAGIGAPAQATDVPASRQEADESLALFEAIRPDAQALAYDESWSDILLHRLRAAARSARRPPRGPVDELRRHDMENGTSYLQTLRAWLEAQGDPVEAGARLGVHANTVRYRLRKMAEITPLDLDDPSKRLATLIELATLED